MAIPESEILSGLQSTATAPPSGAGAANAKNLTGTQKAAVLLITLGIDACAAVFKHLKPEELERLSNELVRQDRVDIETKKSVFSEFASLYQTSQLLSQGGLDYAREVLQQAIGTQKAQSLVDRIMGARGGEPSEWLQHVEPGQLARTLQNEQPQTIALVVAQLAGPRAAQVLAILDPELRAKVTRKIARMEAASPEVVIQIEETLRAKLSGVESDDLRSVSGVQMLVEILNSGDRGLERSVLDSLAADEPSLADEIKRKLFVFEDILQLDDKAIQVVLREVEQDDLRLALRGSQEAVKEKIFKNMSDRASETLREDIETSGPVRLKDVEAAQQRIALVIRSLEERGDVVVARGDAAEDQLV